MSEQPKLNILWHSVAPYVRTGYGNVTKNVCFRLKKLGYSVVISAFYGIDRGGLLNLGGIPCLPCPQDNTYGSKVVPIYIEKFNIQLPIVHSDFWAFNWFAELRNACCYSPTDNEGYQEDYIKVLKRYDDFIVPSKWSQKQCLQYRKDVRYFPHGVDTKVYRPLDKIECRRHIGISPDKFIIGTVAGNYDGEPRKGWDQFFLGYKRFLQANPLAKKNSMIFAYTHASEVKGFNLAALAKSLKLEKNISFPDEMVNMTGLADEEMARLYNSFDVEVNVSRREGFCMPIIEAEACGVPVIATNFSSMPELVKGHGWLIDRSAWVYTPLGGKCALPDESGIAKALEEAYIDHELREKYAKSSRNFALNYDWDSIIDKYWIPYLNEKSEILGKPGKPRLICKNN